MTVISDAEFDRAAELTPRHLLRYLRGRGWSALRGYGRGELWGLTAEDAGPGAEPVCEVMVPLDRGPRDYADRVADLLATLSMVEGRVPAEVLREMTLPPADWQYLRLLPDGPPGTAPLVELVPALSGLKELMTAAAAAAYTREPRPVQPAQKPQRVKDFVASVRLDQTRVGSYVIAAHTPIPEVTEARPTQESLPFDGGGDGSTSEPFARRVSRSLYAGVLSAQRAAETSVREDSLDAFSRYAGAGALTANLCEALARIGSEETRPYELSFAWTAELPMDQRTPPVAIGRQLLPALVEGARDLRDRLGQSDVVFRGTVVRLHRERGEGPGEATVQGYVTEDFESTTRRVRMQLGAEDYAKAGLAHNENHEVFVRGDLVRYGRVTRMEPVISFTVKHVYD